jgi:hypothetical protein
MSVCVVSVDVTGKDVRNPDPSWAVTASSDEISNRSMVLRGELILKEMLVYLLVKSTHPTMPVLAPITVETAG